MNTEAITTIMSRRSTRKFLDKPVETELLNTVIEAGRAAPSGGNSQTTHFIVIQNRQILAELEEKVLQTFAGMEETPGMYKSMVNSIRAARTGNYCYDYKTPVLIVTANQKDYGNNIADCACALENMMVAANALNLGSVWINQLRWLNKHPVLVKALQDLGMKESERVYGALALGYPDTADGLPNRSPLPRTGNQVTWVD